MDLRASRDGSDSCATHDAATRDSALHTAYHTVCDTPHAPLAPAAGCRTLICLGSRRRMAGSTAHGRLVAAMTKTQSSMNRPSRLSSTGSSSTSSAFRRYWPGVKMPSICTMNCLRNHGKLPTIDQPKNCRTTVSSTANLTPASKGSSNHRCAAPAHAVRERKYEVRLTPRTPNTDVRFHRVHGRVVLVRPLA